MKQGFSLVELAIVLVVLALITGGILVGQSLLRASELRSATVEYQRYQAAVATFRDKYLSLPGDMPNATTYWGAQDPTPATCQAAASTTVLTCDGDGDGYIGYTSYYENFRFWQHLANAGLVEGIFTGVTGSGGTREAVIGTNSPASKVRGAGWSVDSQGIVVAGNVNLYEGTYYNIFRFGAQTTGVALKSAALKPEEAWSIDTKLDDGKPAYGRVTSYKSTAAFLPGCTTTAASDTAEYAVSTNAILCSLMLKAVN